uniref:Uncharacterized protein n=1 Tax=Romanomermis culicivorax TaxID=13658 RepID=A0A915JDT8_ROMCU
MENTQFADYLRQNFGLSDIRSQKGFNAVGSWSAGVLQIVGIKSDKRSNSVIIAFPRETNFNNVCPQILSAARKSGMIILKDEMSYVTEEKYTNAQYMKDKLIKPREIGINDFVLLIKVTHILVA